MKRILIAEDDRDFRALLETTLKNRGFETVAAPNGPAAWRLIQRDVPDAIILDMNMPGLNGLEVCRLVRANPRTSHIGVIFLTAHQEPEFKAAAVSAGADDYLIKPFKPDELRLRIDTVLQRATTSTRSAPAATHQGQVIALIGGKGGVGTSVLAVNLAVALALTAREVSLVDLDLEHASHHVLLALELFRHGTLGSLARGQQPNFDWPLLEAHLLTHSSGAKVLPGPLTPVDAELVTGQHVRRAIELLRQHHDQVILDLDSSFREVNLDTFEVCDRLVLVITPDLLALNGAQTIINVLKQLRLPQEKVQLVVNQTAPLARVSLGDIRRVVKAPLIAAIPYGGEEFVNAFHDGTPIVQQRPEHATSLAIRKLPESLVVPLQQASGAPGRV